MNWAHITVIIHIEKNILKQNIWVQKTKLPYTPGLSISIVITGSLGGHSLYIEANPAKTYGNFFLLSSLSSSRTNI